MLNLAGGISSELLEFEYVYVGTGAYLNGANARNNKWGWSGIDTASSRVALQGITKQELTKGGTSVAHNTLDNYENKRCIISSWRSSFRLLCIKNEMG